MKKMQLTGVGAYGVELAEMLATLLQQHGYISNAPADLTELLIAGSGAVKKDSALPAVVLEIQGGLINCVRSSVPMRVVILDADTEGGNDESIREINGDDAYVHDYTLSPSIEPGFDGVDPDFVKDVLDHVKG